MEFEYDPKHLNSGNFIIITDADVKAFNKLNHYDGRRQYYQKLEKLIDVLGELSAQEQFLKKPITTFHNLVDTNHKLYLAVDPEFNNGHGGITGYIKIGQKKLFLTDGVNEQVAVNIQCVLDFYVHKSEQRRGWGKTIFDHMLKRENLTPCMMAYDRPSPKLTMFLKKHYGLRDSVWQPNRYTVFREYFHTLSNNNNLSSHDNRKHKQAQDHNNLGKIFPRSYIPDTFSGPPNTQKRLDSISKIIHQVPPSP